jgi:hypothetical protein
MVKLGFLDFKSTQKNRQEKGILFLPVLSCFKIELNLFSVSLFFELLFFRK